jgi:hypothetical protein
MGDLRMTKGRLRWFDTDRPFVVGNRMGAVG